MSITSERIRENCFIHHLMDAAADDIEALEQELATITKQRDLAVEALEAMAQDGWLLCGPEGLSDAQKKVCEALYTIKESEGK